MRDSYNSRRNGSNTGGTYNPGGGSSSYGAQNRKNSGGDYNPGGGYNAGGSYNPGGGYNLGDRYNPGTTDNGTINTNPVHDPKEKKNLFGFLHFDQGSMSAIKIICMIVIGVLALMLVVKLGMIVVSGFGPFVDAASAVLDMIFNRFMSAVIGGVVIYVLIMAFGSHFIPPSIRRKLLPILIACLLLYSVAPALGTAVGELVIIVIGIMIAISVIIK
jgi:MFS family permease